MSFRDWLRAQYRSIEELKHASGTTFWSPVYSCFSEPQPPITRNFMGFFSGADCWAWAKEGDVVSNDAYPNPVEPSSLALSAMT